MIAVFSAVPGPTNFLLTFTNFAHLTGVLLNNHQQQKYVKKHPWGFQVNVQILHIDWGTTKQPQTYIGTIDICEKLPKGFPSQCTKFTH